MAATPTGGDQTTGATVKNAPAKPVEATIPKAESKPRAGAIEVGEKGGASLAGVVAAESLTSVAETIAREVCEHGGRVVIVEDRNVAEGDVVYSELQGRFDLFAAAFGDARTTLEAEPEPAEPVAWEQTANLAPLFAAATVISSLVGLGQLAGDFLGLFRADYTVSARDVKVERLALIAEVIRYLRASDMNVLMPALSLVQESGIFGRFNTLLIERYKLSSLVDQHEAAHVLPTQDMLDAIGKRLDALIPEQAKAVAALDQSAKARLDEEISKREGERNQLRDAPAFQRAKARISAVKGIIAAFDEYSKAITNAPPEGNAPLTSGALREQIRSWAAAPPEEQNSDGVVAGQSPPKVPTNELHLLYLEVTSVGADVVTRNRLLFFHPEQAAFLGAVQATYILAATNGGILASGAPTKFAHKSFDFERTFGG